MNFKKTYLLITISCLFMTTLAFASRGLEVVSVRDSAGKQVGLYKESHALVIGAGNYTSGWPKLTGIKKDVRLVHKVLEEHGFNVITVNDPEKEQLRNAFDDFINKYGQKLENRLLFYFAGHGYTKKMSYGEEMGYIVPVNAPNPENDPNGFLAKAMDMHMIEVFAKRIQSKHVIFLFDSCFSGSLFALSRAIPGNISYNTLKPIRQFITAGNADEEMSSDESVFTQQFIAALEGEGDVNEDGYVTGTELGEFLQDKAINTKGEKHPQYGKIRNPNLDKGDFVFVIRDRVEKSPEQDIHQAPDIVENNDNFEKITKEVEAPKRNWNDWQETMTFWYSQNNELDKGTALKPSEKVQMWKNYLSRYSADNPLSTDDQMMRRYAVERIEYWKHNKNPAPIKKQSVIIQNQVRNEQKHIKKPGSKLRLWYKPLSVDEVQAMPNISIRKMKRWGFYGHSTIKHNYELVEDDGDKVVIDHATGLMWHQSGSKGLLDWDEANEWIKRLNLNNYAGYSDWRLPTLEEAVSLLESSKEKGRYIDPIFHGRQKYIWTGDEININAAAAWYVNYSKGHANWAHMDGTNGFFFARPVRLWNDTAQ
ncbi:MAG: DUF1566 domain-containing protein [Candidatus Scalinduaceae bacterium]